MATRIKFLGDDDSFFKELELKFSKVYEGHEFVFLHSSLNNTSDMITLFQELYNDQVDIIFLDFENSKDKASTLAKLINTNSELRRKSLCGLHGYEDREQSIDIALREEIRINHIKGIEDHDMIFDTMSFVNIEKAKSPPFISGDSIEELTAYFTMRVRSLKKNYYQVECNLKMHEMSVVEVNQHPLDYFVKSNRFLVKNFRDENLFYNKRFAYDLHFTYIDDSFFRSSEEAWLALQKFPDRKEYEANTEEDFEVAERLVKARGLRTKALVNEVSQWIEEHKDREKKKTKVMFYDDELKFIDSFTQLTNFKIRYETGAATNFHQIKRFRPHFVVFNVTEKNTAASAQELLNFFKTEERVPIVLLLNTDEDFSYDKYLTYPEDLDFATLSTIFENFNTKRQSTEVEKESRVYFAGNHPKIEMEASLKVKVLKLSESEVYFECDQEIPDWSVIKIKKPFFMLFTIVPQLEKSEFKGVANTYRALINATTEITKPQLRRLVNKSFEEVEELDEESSG